MLKRIKIKNFQSHKDTELSFVPGVNVLLGLGQSGKTSVIRALQLVLTNRPLGARFFSDFAGKKGTTEVELELSEGNMINLQKQISLSKEREKLVRSSSYKMDGQEYVGFGDKVPDLIADKLNMSVLNIQEQFDKPFLITSPPGEVARELNRITRLEKADEWTKALATQVNSVKGDVELLKQQLKEKKKELEAYEDLPAMEKDVEKAERIKARLDVSLEEEANLRYLISHLDDIEVTLVEQKRILDVEPLVDQAERLLEELEERRKEKAGIERGLAEIEYVEERSKIGNEIELIPSGYLTWLLEQDWMYTDAKAELLEAIEYEMAVRDRSDAHFYKEGE